MEILVIEDVREDRARVESVLRAGGYENLSFTANITEASEALGLNEVPHSRVQPLQLVLIGDASHMDYLAFFRRLKDSPHYQDVPIIVLSPRSAAETLQMAFAFGATDYVKKPFTDYELLARVRSALRLKHEIDRRVAREKELLEAARQLSDLNGLLTRLSLIDSLTGVANRRCFDQTLEKEWRRCSRNAHPISLVMIDVDHFKLYNDTYGHQAGDACLGKVANAIRQTLKRPGDLVCRYGGEEFAVILPDTPLVGAQVVAEHVRAAVEALGIIHASSKTAAHVTVSLGFVSMVPSDGADVPSFLALADAALYEAKAAGRNRCQWLSPNPVPEKISV